MNKLNPPETAPKDGSTILVDMGYPWMMVATWNKPTDQWCYAELQVDLYEGEWNDTYFQNEYEPHNAMIGWMPIPEIER